MEKTHLKFTHGSQALENGNFIGFAVFRQDETNEIRQKRVAYPEQFETAEQASEHAYQAALKGRDFPF